MWHRGVHTGKEKYQRSTLFHLQGHPQDSCTLVFASRPDLPQPLEMSDPLKEGAVAQVLNCFPTAPRAQGLNLSPVREIRTVSRAAWELPMELRMVSNS